MTKTEWITRQQAAQQLGVSLRTIRRYMESGRLSYYREEHNGRVWIYANSLSTPVPPAGGHL